MSAKNYGVAAVGSGVLALVAILFSHIQTTRDLLVAAQANGGAPKLLAELVQNPAFEVILVVVAIALGVRANLANRSSEEGAPKDDHGSVNVTQNANPTINVNIPELPHEHTMRIKYSGIQVVSMSNEPFGVHQCLDLGGCAQLVALGEWSNDAVQLVLPNAAPLRIDSPSADTVYRSGGTHVRFPASGRGVDIREATLISNPAAEFRFDSSHSAHDVTVDGRTFRVKLLSIRDRSGQSLHTFKPMIFREYEFSVQEQ
jgi:hypothetical protein